MILYLRLMRRKLKYNYSLSRWQIVIYNQLIKSALGDLTSNKICYFVHWNFLIIALFGFNQIRPNNVKCVIKFHRLNDVSSYFKNLLSSNLSRCINKVLKPVKKNINRQIPSSYGNTPDWRIHRDIELDVC